MRGLGIRLPAFVLPLAFGLAAGCAQTVSQDVAAPADAPKQAAVAGVPLIKQQDFYCGPASLAMALQWSGSKVTQADIAAQAFSPGAEGTYLADMIGTARRRDQLAVEISSFPDLFAEVAAGNPVIVFQNLGLNWAPKWHYAVVVGYDLEQKRMMLNSGELDRMTMPFRLFNQTWRRGDYWGLVVLPPDRLPALRDEWTVYRAAAALEKSGRHKAAATAYAKGASRWPKSWIWPFGLGNARYRRGDLAGARQAFARAVALESSIPEARQNLAQVEREIAARAAPQS